MSGPSYGYPSTDPRHHTATVKQMIEDVAREAREGVGKVDDPKARALLGTTAEVLDGLRRAYDHFEGRSEQSWR